MGEPLDPELARALREPARLVRADPRLLDLVRDGGAPAREQLRTQASGADTVEDRYASAALLAQLFGDRGPLDRAARGDGSPPPPELLALADVDALRPALRAALASPVLTGLLEWATRPDAAAPPLELAMAARDLHLEDAAVLRSVAGRAEQLAAQTGKRGQRPPLQRLAEVLRQAAGASPGTAAPGPDHASRPSPGDPEPPGSEAEDAGAGRTSAGPAPAGRRGTDPSDGGRAGTQRPGTGPGAVVPGGTGADPEAPNPSEPGAGDSGSGGPGTPGTDRPGSGGSSAAPGEADPPGSRGDEPGSRHAGGTGPDPTRRGPRVTTEGIPAAEMLGPDELDHPDPYSPDYPGTGVPVRDSISGPRPGSERRPPGAEDAPGDRDSGDPRDVDDAGLRDHGNPDPAPTDGPAAPGGPAAPRVPSTSEQYYGAGSDRYAEYDPRAPETREGDRHVLRNWGLVFLVIVAVIILLTLLL